MSTPINEWSRYKDTILEQMGDFSVVYGDLGKQRPSGNDWIQAQCPFHEDKNPSFGYNKTTGQWKCLAGCGGGSVFDFLMAQTHKDFKDVLLEWGDRLSVSRPESVGPSRGPLKIYNYHNENGELLFQVVRGPGKKFRQRRPNGKGGWKWNLRGVRRVLYQLPDLQKSSEKTVYLVEGEKDADRLEKEGLLATTNPGGAGKWQEEYSAVLSGRDVVILPDNDTAGRHHAKTVAAALHDIAKTVQIIELPDLPEKGDVSDWLDAGHKIEELKTLIAENTPWHPDQQDTQRPIIQINDRQLRNVIHDAWTAVQKANTPPQLFNSSGRLVRLSLGNQDPAIDPMDEASMYGHLLRTADWLHVNGTGARDAKPPREIARDMLVNPAPDLPVLDAVVTTPVFAVNGQLIFEPGYHDDSHVWMHRAGEQDLPKIAVEPSGVQVTDSLELLQEELLYDFPWTAESDEAHALAALLLPFARRLISGPTPIHLIESPTPGSGKSLLADLISIIAHGRSCEPTTLSRDENENRKKITAILARGAPIVLLDNVKNQLDSAQLASALTADTWSDRILGQTRMVQYPNRATWLVTANNPRLSLEIARRSVRIRLEPAEERPWERTEFKHDPIRQWAHENRSDLVYAVLIIIQNWLAAGYPVGGKSLGSFETWATVIGGILQCAGVRGFLEDTDDFYAAADQEGREWRAFAEFWWEKYQDNWVSTSDLLSLAEDNDTLGFVLGDKSDRSKRIRLGRALTGLRDRRFGDRKIAIGQDSHTKSQCYRLVPIAGVLFDMSNDGTESNVLRVNAGNVAGS